MATDYLDLRRLLNDLANELGVDPDTLREVLHQHPTAGPHIGRDELLELLALVELEQAEQEECVP